LAGLLDSDIDRVASHPEKAPLLKSKSQLYDLGLLDSDSLNSILKKKTAYSANA